MLQQPCLRVFGPLPQELIFPLWLPRLWRGSAEGGICPLSSFSSSDFASEERSLDSHSTSLRAGLGTRSRRRGKSVFSTDEYFFSCLFDRSTLLRVRSGENSPKVNNLKKIRMQKICCVYILSSKTRVLYIGVTSRLQKRLYEHKNGIIDGFSKKYKTHSLVYFECTENMYSALAREKQLKKWRRKKRFFLSEGRIPNGRI